MWYNPMMIWILESSLHGMLSGSIMVISITGRKSGKSYRLPVNYIQQGETLLTISYKNRTWWRNLRGGSTVTIRLHGKDVAGKAEVVEDEIGVAEGFRIFCEKDPRTVRAFGVRLGADGHLDPEHLKQVARELVIIRISLI